MKNIAAASVGTVNNQQQLLPTTSSFPCINDDDADNLVVAGTKENTIQDMLNEEGGGSLKRKSFQEAADVRLGSNDPKIDLMLHHATSPRSTRQPADKVPPLLLICFKPPNSTY